MKIIYRPRRSGRTTEIIKLAAKDFFYIVCLNQEESHRIADLAKEMGLRIPFPITFAQFTREDYFPPEIKGFVIDNVDILIGKMGRGSPVKAISLEKRAREGKT